MSEDKYSKAKFPKPYVPNYFKINPELYEFLGNSKSRKEWKCSWQKQFDKVLEDKAE